jgi:putative tryptophan/tyrosine transport system substrate-binding protein
VILPHDANPGRTGFSGTTADDAEAKDRAVALQQGLQKLRWTVGRDLQINYLFAAGNAERLLAYANEAVASKPDILLAQTNPAVKALQNVTRTLPIVFLQVSDPVGAGFVRSLSHPGENITGFTNFEAEIGGKWLPGEIGRSRMPIALTRDLKPCP